jgi:hypothetical protein
LAALKRIDEAQAPVGETMGEDGKAAALETEDGRQRNRLQAGRILAAAQVRLEAHAAGGTDHILGGGRAVAEPKVMRHLPRIARNPVTRGNHRQRNQTAIALRLGPRLRGVLVSADRKRRQSARIDHRHRLSPSFPAAWRPKAGRWLLVRAR